LKSTGPCVCRSDVGFRIPLTAVQASRDSGRIAPLDQDRWTKEVSQATCAYQKLNPTILMMKSAEDRPSNELAKPLDRPTAWRILVQRQVRSAFVVIAGVGRSDPAQMALAEDNRMIKALPADRADQSFRIPVLPR